jgi:hypothetical protein
MPLSSTLTVVTGVAAGAFTVVAVFQVGWAGLVHFRPARWVLALGAVANAAVVGGWVLSRTWGIPFIDGFQDAEEIALTDAVVAALEVLIVPGAVTLLTSPVRRPWLTDRLANVHPRGRPPTDSRPWTAGVVTSPPVRVETNRRGGH